MRKHDAVDDLYRTGNWYAVDFDGVLAEQIWPEPGIGPVIERNIPKLEDVRRAGREIIIHSARHWADYPALEAWLKANRIPYDAIVLGKLIARRYVDDKAINSEESSWLD